MSDVPDDLKAGDELPFWIKAAGVLGAVLLFATISFGLFRHFYQNKTFSGLGEFGDFVGGFSNPLLALLGFLALLYTISIQQRELGLSRRELELTRQELDRSASALEAQTDHLDRQNASRSFYDMFEMYKSVVSEMQTGAKENKKSGKAALDRYADYFYGWSMYVESSYSLEKNAAIHKKYNNDLGNYFRLIYRIFGFLENSPDSDFFADMFRAQFTTAELHLLFFNCLSEVGSPMMKYAKRYELFDNMPVPAGDGIEDLLGKFDRVCFGKNKEIIALIEQ